MTMMRIAAAAIVLLHFLLLPTIPASEVVFNSKFCRGDHLAFSDTPGDKSFYVNGQLVDKILFCDALKFHQENGCFFEDHWCTDLCGLETSQVKSQHSESGARKVLRRLMNEAATDDASSPLSENESIHGSLFSHKAVGMVLPGAFALCCVVLCPCFYKKRKEMHPVLAKESSTAESVRMSEMISAPEKIPGSPLREKIPGSPFRVPSTPSRFSSSPKLSRLGSVDLNLNQVVKATRNFSSSMVIGEGGFGTVYRAQLENGLVVAVKRAKKEHFDSLSAEFRSEVELLSKIDHRNLVKLLGFVDQGTERLIITEYVPNGTLRAHLDGLRGKILDFNERLEIIIDVAHGLTYLHSYTEKQIIHRDVKSSNILLTDNLRAKVADFGFARIGTASDSDKTHISTKVKGTIGYLDPEYMRTYQLTSKSDVYSFGILLLETITGRRPVEQTKPADERVTLRWVFRKFNGGNAAGLVDPRMEEVVDPEILDRIISLAIQCAAPVRVDRPDMRTVGEQLWGIRVDYLKTIKRAN